MPTNNERMVAAERAAAALQRMGLKPTSRMASAMASVFNTNPDAIDRLDYISNVYGETAQKFDSAAFKNAFGQYDYYKKRTAAGYDPIEIADSSWDPSQYDDDANEALGAWYKQNKALPAADQQEQFQAQLRKYKLDKAVKTRQDTYALAGFSSPGSTELNFNQDWKRLGYDYDAADAGDVRRRQLGMPPGQYLAQYDGGAEVQDLWDKAAREPDGKAKAALQRQAQALQEEDRRRLAAGQLPKRLDPQYQQDLVIQNWAQQTDGPIRAAQNQAQREYDQWDREKFVDAPIREAARQTAEQTPAPDIVGDPTQNSRAADGQLRHVVAVANQQNIQQPPRSYGALDPLLNILRTAVQVNQKEIKRLDDTGVDTQPIKDAMQSAANTQQNLIHSPFGAGMVAAANTAAFGLPEFMERKIAANEAKMGISEDQRLTPIFQQLREERPTASAVGEIAGMLVPGAGLEHAASGILSRAFPKLASPLLKGAIVGGAAFGVQSAVLDIGKGKSAQEVAQDFLLNAAMGGFGDAGFRMVTELVGGFVPKLGSELFNRMLKSGELLRRLQPASKNLAATFRALNTMEAEQAAAARAQNAAADAGEAPYVATRNIESPKTLTPAEAERAGVTKPTVFRDTDTGVTLKPGQEVPLALPESKPTTEKIPTKFGNERIQVNAITPAELQQLKKSGEVPETTMRSALARDAQGNVYHMDLPDRAGTGMDRPLELPAGRKPFARLTPYESAGTAWGKPQRLAELNVPKGNGLPIGPDFERPSKQSGGRLPESPNLPGKSRAAQVLDTPSTTQARLDYPKAQNLIDPSVPLADVRNGTLPGKVQTAPQISGTLPAPQPVVQVSSPSPAGSQSIGKGLSTGPKLAAASDAGQRMATVHAASTVNIGRASPKPIEAPQRLNTAAQPRAPEQAALHLDWPEQIAAIEAAQGHGQEANSLARFQTDAQVQALRDVGQDVAQSVAGGDERGYTRKRTLGESESHTDRVSKDYKATFFSKHPELEKKVIVHHAIEQQVLKRPETKGLFSEDEIHAYENLRGVPKESNPDLHSSLIRKEWNRFYRMNPMPTKEDILRKRIEIDNKYGKLFNPPQSAE